MSISRMILSTPFAHLEQVTAGVQRIRRPTESPEIGLKFKPCVNSSRRDLAIQRSLVECPDDPVPTIPSRLSGLAQPCRSLELLPSAGLPSGSSHREMEGTSSRATLLFSPDARTRPLAAELFDHPLHPRPPDGLGISASRSASLHGCRDVNAGVPIPTARLSHVLWLPPIRRRASSL